jgi:hypothetical protein
MAYMSRTPRALNLGDIPEDDDHVPFRHRQEKQAARARTVPLEDQSTNAPVVMEAGSNRVSVEQDLDNAPSYVLGNLLDEVLIAHRETPDTKEMSFVASLTDSVTRYNTLSAKQKYHAARLVRLLHPRWTSSARATAAVVARAATTTTAAARPATTGSLDYAPLERLMRSAAASGLKYPKITMGFPMGPVTLSMAGPSASFPGSINVTDGKPYGSSTWYGRITSGVFVQSTRVGQHVYEAVAEAMSHLAHDPASAIRAYGRQSGQCACCGRPLTDPASMAIGVGPVCAKHFGLGA